jgi:bifunctional non-homologous end joining protein LigD
MLATRAESSAELPRGDGWVYEVKWDGVRVLADTTEGGLRLWARSGREVTAAYPELAELSQVPGAVLDGEVVVLAGGTPSFEALAERMHVRDPARAARLAARVPVTFMVFDVLSLDGVDLTRRPWDERRSALEGLALPGRVVLSPVYPDVDDLWQVTAEHGLEGVLAKRRRAPYRAGRRSPDWVKAAHRATRTATVVGWRAEHAASGPRSPAPGAAGGRLGAVLLGAPDEDGRWRYLGKAGSGLGGRRGQDLASELAGTDVARSPLDEPVPAADARGVTWCAPRVVVDVAYLQRTRGGRLRQPVVRGMRTDSPTDPWEAP